MTRSTDFAATVRSGRRVRRGDLVVHQRRGSADQPHAPASVGFIVGRAVGGSVVRHRTSRRLRAIMAARVAELPAGSATVVRALPRAGIADSAALAADVSSALAALHTASDRGATRRVAAGAGDRRAQS